MVSGLAPDKLALTRKVGNSACGNDAMGNLLNANSPNNTMAAVSNNVATGRRIKKSALHIKMSLLEWVLLPLPV
jgi:hypothetical protein